MKTAFINSNKISAYASGSLNRLSFAVKDNIDIAGEVTGYGSPSWANTHAKAISNAVCLEQLLSEGATCLGKTISDELAYSLIGINHFYGTPPNPKAPERVPGGSSSGSASAVASGIVDFSIGTDTAGSVRVPASNCGVWGYRPSHGLISVAGVEAQAPSFDTVGVFANNAQTLIKVIQVLLGNTHFPNNYSTPSICFLDDVFANCDDEIKQAMTSVIANISRCNTVKNTALGAIVAENINCNDLFEISAHLISAEIWNTLASWVENCKPELSPFVKANVENYAKSANRSEIQKSMCAKTFFAEKLNAYLNDGNILCFPTTPILAPRLVDVTPELIAGDYYPRVMGINAISGLSRTPQITIPITSCSGVPIGLSFVAGYGQDLLLATFCKELVGAMNNSPINLI